LSFPAGLQLVIAGCKPDLFSVLTKAAPRPRAARLFLCAIRGG
jgi:hypothetical protein